MNHPLSTIWVNGKSISAPANSTIMQACLLNNIEIPRFCYHEQLAIAGNCRMCLVEVEKSPKLVASCAMPIINGMKIVTTSSIVKKAREGVLEFLLLNHPLDCPICDQGGECDLQDQAMIYGSDRGRFYEFKRTVQDKHVGPLIKTIMTCCIHCTRCVRFISDIANTPSLGTTGRGTNTEITTYVKKLWLNSNISGNIIDLCPVGALTSKPYAFKARPWELQSKETVDVLDPFCMKIRVDLNPFEVVRVLPLNNKWISDKTRFSYDGLTKQRLLAPMHRETKNKVLTPLNWESLFMKLQTAMTAKSVLFHIGSLTNLETLIAAKLFKDHHTNNVMFTLEDVPSSYLTGAFSVTAKPTISVSALSTMKLVLLADVSIDEMVPLLNTCLTKHQDVWYVGTYNKSIRGKTKHLGFSSRTMSKLTEGKHFASRRVKATQVANVFIHKQAGCIQSFGSFMTSHFAHQMPMPSSVAVNNSLAILSKELFYNKNSEPSIRFDVQWFLNSNSAKSTSSSISDSVVVYHGTHADKIVPQSDFVIPGMTYTESEMTVLDVDGAVQKTNNVTSFPSLSFICTEAEFLVYLLLVGQNKTVVSTLSDIRFLVTAFLKNYINKFYSHPSVSGNKSIMPSSVEFAALYCTSFTDDYYTNNYISRASATMARCSMLKSTETSKTF
uniref:NADH dehydrogenase subunit 11 n=1 Tax=Tsukubamonas globosa TaxID=875863 RepID=W8VR99_9EUKA|nr:NADH dehydrogenase subunit 11 [Tsukubamonas globosa]BAO51949.1 NADH dehydrogenase subunit 11 [Tsukubamonas globosa]